MYLVAPTRGGLWLQTLYDSLHVPLFGIIAVCLLVITPTHWSRLKRLSTVIVIVVALSVLSEIAQIPTGRDASLNDLLADWFGAAGFLAVAIVFSSSISVPKGRGRYLVILGIGLTVWPLVPLANVSAAYLERNQLLPELVSFNATFGDMFFHVQKAETLRVRRSVGNAFSAEGTESLPLNIRVHDRTHRNGDQPYDDRFNLSVDLAPGFQSIRIALTDLQSAPIGRQMNMTEIDGLVVFATQQEAGRKFVLHVVRLE
jgi:hypothetical protein